MPLLLVLAVSACSDIDAPLPASPADLADIADRDLAATAVDGFAIEIDASAIATAQLNVDYGAGGTFANGAVNTARLSAGSHLVCAPASWDCVQFDVSDTGAVDYDASLNGVLSGRGSHRLTLVGTDLTLDLTALDTDFFNLNYNQIGGRELPKGQPATLRVLPGSYTLCAPSSWDCVSFVVSKAGTVDYETDLDGFLHGRGGRVLTLTGASITIDPTAIDADNFNLNYNHIGGSDFARQVKTFSLLPGSYTFCAPSSWDCVAFTVTRAGTLDYEADLDGFLHGRGGHVLTLTGASITIDPTTLDTDNFNLNYNHIGGSDFARQVKTFSLLPGSYTFCAPSSWDCVAFSVTRAATLDYDADLDGFLHGRGGRVLTLTGASITIDPTTLDTDNFNLNYNHIGGSDFARQVKTFSLLPGSYTYCAPSSWDCVAFTVDKAGTLDYQADLEGFLHGRGGHVLTLTGAAITIDPTTLDADSFNLNYNHIGGRDFAREIKTFSLLPGSYTYCAPASWQCVAFSVTRAGTLDYAPELDAFLHGRGGRVLTLTGASIRIDPTRLSASGFNIDYNHIGGHDFANAMATFSLLPGRYTLCAPAAWDCFVFDVTLAGLVDYPAASNTFLQGRDTHTLIVRGLPITVDSRPLSGTTYNLNYSTIGGSAFSTGDVRTFWLVPGSYTLCAPAQTNCFVFETSVKGLLKFAASLDTIVRGRSTRILTLIGLPH